MHICNYSHFAACREWAALNERKAIERLDRPRLDAARAVELLMHKYINYSNIFSDSQLSAHTFRSRGGRRGGRARTHFAFCMFVRICETLQKSIISSFFSLHCVFVGEWWNAPWGCFMCVQNCSGARSENFNFRHFNRSSLTRCVLSLVNVDDFGEDHDMTSNRRPEAARGQPTRL